MSVHGLSSVKRLVVKVGSALVTHANGGPNTTAINHWGRQIALLKKEGIDVIMVSSGAIACGMQRIGRQERPRFMHELQACAAIGQMDLARAYEQAFGQYGLPTAQILLTHNDLSDRTRYLNARATLSALSQFGVVPIINENDTVVTDEIRLGDNDTLGALVANLAEADALIILTDQNGLYTADPRQDPNATLVATATAGDPALEKMAGGAGSAISKGGMLTKILAAQRAAKSGTHTIIASGREPDVIVRLAHGESICTLLVSTQEPLAARKQWLADHLQLAGHLTLDSGAVAALRRGKSLLPIGVKTVEGDFKRGAAVALHAPDGSEIARGLISYNSSQARRMAGYPTKQIEERIGYMDTPELVHHDNMVLF